MGPKMHRWPFQVVPSKMLAREIGRNLAVSNVGFNLEYTDKAHYLTQFYLEVLHQWSGCRMESFKTCLFPQIATIPCTFIKRSQLTRLSLCRPSPTMEVYLTKWTLDLLAISNQMITRRAHSQLIPPTITQVWTLLIMGQELLKLSVRI